MLLAFWCCTRLVGFRVRPIDVPRGKGLGKGDWESGDLRGGDGWRTGYPHAPLFSLFLHWFLAHWTLFYGAQSALLRKHLTLRTRIKRLTRKTIYFSRSIQMHDIVIGLFVNRYEFGLPV